MGMVFFYCILATRLSDTSYQATSIFRLKQFLKCYLSSHIRLVALLFHFGGIKSSVLSLFILISNLFPFQCGLNPYLILHNAV